jgi:hypothetical protein
MSPSEACDSGQWDRHYSVYPGIGEAAVQTDLSWFILNIQALANGKSKGLIF